MVETQEIKDAFMARLNQALDAKEGVRKGRGRNVDLYEGVRKHPSFKASTQATHKWLKAESMPSRANMMAIAEWLGVRVEWLQYGKGEPFLPAAGSSPIRAGDVIEPGPPIVSPLQPIPIVGTAQMGPDGYWDRLDSSEGFVDAYSTDVDAYALRLRGDSMAPAIKSGWVAICEPNSSCAPGEYVMIRLKNGESMVKEFLYANAEEVSVLSVNTEYGRRTIPLKDIERMHCVPMIVSPRKVRV